MIVFDGAEAEAKPVGAILVKKLELVVGTYLDSIEEAIFGFLAGFLASISVGGGRCLRAVLIKTSITERFSTGGVALLDKEVVEELDVGEDSDILVEEELDRLWRRGSGADGNESSMSSSITSSSSSEITRVGVCRDETFFGVGLEVEKEAQALCKLANAVFTSASDEAGIDFWRYSTIICRCEDSVCRI